MDVPEAAMDKRHRRHRQARSGEGKAYVRPGLKLKLSVHVEMPELDSEEEITTASDHSKDELPESECSTPVAVATLDVESELWPSLREAANDFDFCSEFSEVSEVESIATTSSWVAVGSEKSYAAAAKKSPSQKPCPVLKKTATEPARPLPEVSALPEEPEEPLGAGDMRQKGWQKAHKASQSATARRKVAYQAARRAEQRQRCKEALQD